MQNMYWMTQIGMYYMCRGHLMQVPPYWHKSALEKPSWEDWLAEASLTKMSDADLQHLEVLIALEMGLELGKNANKERHDLGKGEHSNRPNHAAHPYGNGHSTSNGRDLA